MSNVLVDGFFTYGTGSASSGDAVGLAMLSGVWSSVPGVFSNGATIQTLPWAPQNLDRYISMPFNNNAGEGFRRALPAAVATSIFSFYFACDNLPANPVYGNILNVSNNANQVMATLWLDTTGTLSVKDGSGNTLATTSGPVIVPQSAVHIECLVTPSTGTFKVYVAGNLVLNATGLTFTNSANIAQFTVLTSASTVGGSGGRKYMSHLIVRDTNGSYNNAITGDRKVATLLPNLDDAAHQGWTPRYFKRFGVGILDLTIAGSYVASPVTTTTDPGVNDYTIEGEFRFQTLPTGNNKATLFGKWDETSGNQRSYQLYLGGATLENGLLVFRTSTDGTNGTVVEKGKWAWTPDTDRWYHIALVRASSVLTLYVDGVQVGGTWPDADSYFASSAPFVLGAQTNGNNAVTGTTFDGWQDEFRYSKGLARYTTNFAPPTGAFPRNGSDPNWGSVIWLSSWDNAVVADDGPLALALVAKGSAAAITPNDGQFGYQTLNKTAPNDDSFIEAALIPATGTLTMGAVPANNETVTVGTKDGTNAAVYTFKTALSGAAYEVLIGASVAATAANLVSAINGTSGAGTTYGTGTVANNDVSAATNPSNQVVATALIPGTSGNSIATTETLANGAWGGTTLSGGQNIPSYSQFSLSRLPANTVTVDSITIAARQFRTAAGPANIQNSFVGGGGGVAAGANRTVPNTPTIQFDTFETDPDTGVGLTPTSILTGKIRVNRTA